MKKAFLMTAGAVLLSFGLVLTGCSNDGCGGCYIPDGGTMADVISCGRSGCRVADAIRTVQDGGDLGDLVDDTSIRCNC